MSSQATSGGRGRLRTGASAVTGQRSRRRPARHRLGLIAAGATLLGTAPLGSVFADWDWLLHCLVVVGLVAAGGTVARLLRAPVWAQLVAMLAALALALTWLFRSGGEPLGLLPGPATVAHAADLFSRLPNEVRTQALPVPGVGPFLITTCLGVGLVAILVDLCVVSLRRPALAGLPMLAVYSVPVAVSVQSVSAISFGIAVAGYLWLLGTDNLDRVRRFGRRFTGDGRDVDVWEPSPLAAAGRRLALIGVLIAVTLPVALPGVTTGLVDRFGSGGTGGGGSGGATSVNLFAALNGLLNRDQTVEMMEVSTDDENPHYLRIGVADQITAEGFDHRSPRGAVVTSELEPPPVRAGVRLQRHQAEIQILPGFTMSRLPIYPELRAVSGLSDHWRHDTDQQVLYSSEENATGQEYAIEYSRPEFDPEALRRAEATTPPAGLRSLDEVPAGLHEPAVAELVEELTADHDNPYDQVLAILSHFSIRNGFTYSLETGDETTGSAIVDFLFEHQRGYCVQYAAAMAWMVRELGLPSRVAIGFTSGRNRTEGSYTLTNHNAHAWTEVYFNGFGWVPFDPTPRSSVNGAVNTEWAPDPNASPESDPQDSIDRPDPAAEAGNPQQEENLRGEELATTQDSAEPGGGVSSAAWGALAAGGVVLVLLATPALARWRVRRSRLPRRDTPGGAEAVSVPGEVTGVPTDTTARRRAHAAWDELLDTMVDFGVPLVPAESPRVTADRLVTRYRLDRAPTTDPEQSVGDAVRLLGHAEERARYARTAAPAAGLPDALRAVRRALAGQAYLGTRVRAVLLPPSTLRRWRARVSDATTAVISLVHRLGELLTRVSPRRLLRSSRP